MNNIKQKINIFALFCLVLSFATCFLCFTKDNVFAQNSHKTYKVIYSQICIFSEPNFEGKLLDSDENSITLSYGTIVVGMQVVTGTDGFSYIQIQKPINSLPDGTFYVLASNVLDSSLSSPKRELDANAKTNAQAQTYTKEGNIFTPAIDVLNQNQDIRLIEGFNKSNKYTKIQYKNQDGDLVYSYIETNTISVSNLSHRTIGIVIIILTTISLTILIFGIGKKKKNKKKNT